MCGFHDKLADYSATGMNVGIGLIRMEPLGSSGYEPRAQKIPNKDAQGGRLWTSFYFCTGASLHSWP